MSWTPRQYTLRRTSRMIQLKIGSGIVKLSTADSEKSRTVGIRIPHSGRFSMLNICGVGRFDVILTGKTRHFQGRKISYMAPTFSGPEISI